MEETPWFADGLKFTCTQCGKCCTGEPGYIWVDDDEITKLAASRGVDRKEFVDMFTRKSQGKVTLREKPSGDCIFYDNKRGCTVYKVRPVQCRTWPFWDMNVESPEAWASTEAICPGSGEGELIPVEEILKRVKARAMR